MNPTTLDTAAGLDKTSQAQDPHTRALHESEERLRLAMMVANDGFWDWKLTTNEVYFDPRYYLMAGYAVDEFPHRLEELQQRVHPDDHAQVMAVIQELLNAQSSRYEVEFRFRKKDGDYLWILSKWLIVERDEQGKPSRLVGTHSDITERQQAEEALRESKERSDTLREISPVGVWEITPDRRTLSMNPAMRTLLELDSGADLREREIDSFFTPEGLEVMKTHHAKRPQGMRSSYEVELIGSRGGKRTVIVSGAPLFSGEGKLTSLIGWFTDITERKQAEEALRQKHTMLSRAEHIANMGSWEWDIEADQVRWSEELFRVFQRDPASGAPSFAEHPEIYKPEDMNRLRDAVETCMSKGAPYELELSHITSDGRIRQGIARGYPEYDSAGRIFRLVGSYQDITERKRAEAELQQKLAELQQWYEVMLGREGRVLELKHEADALRQRLGEPPRYALELADDLPAIPHAGDTQP